MKDATLTETSLREMFEAERLNGGDMLHPIGVAIGLPAGLEVTAIHRGFTDEFVLFLSDGRLVWLGDARNLLSFTTAQAKLLDGLALIPPAVARKIWREVAVAIAEVAEATKGDRASPGTHPPTSSSP